MTAPVAPIVAVPAIYDKVTVGIVQTGFSTAQGFANTAFTTATQFISKLEAVADKLSAVPTINPDLSYIALDISAFDYLIGASPIKPGTPNSYVEIPYQSEYLTRLRAHLDSWVTGAATGIAPAVETALWERGRAREVATSNRKAKEAIRSFAMRGFSKPPGALSLEIQDAAQEAQNASLTLSREVMIKQAEMEQSNRRFAMETTIKVEDALLTYLTSQMNRAVESAKSLQNYIATIYQHEVSAFEAQTKFYSAKVDGEVKVFTAEINAEVAESTIRIEALKANVQAMVQKTTVLVETVKAGAQVAAQLAASALSGVNVSAGLSANSGNSTSNSAAYSLSSNYGNNYNQSLSWDQTKSLATYSNSNSFSHIKTETLG